jgi:hypothetical protein
LSRVLAFSQGIQEVAMVIWIERFLFYFIQSATIILNNRFV